VAAGPSLPLPTPTGEQAKGATSKSAPKAGLLPQPAPTAAAVVPGAAPAQSADRPTGKRTNQQRQPNGPPATSAGAGAGAGASGDNRRGGNVERGPGVGGPRGGATTGGRGGRGGRYGGAMGAPTTSKVLEEFDFESMNARFDKVKVAEEVKVRSL
jgi:protein LSM14